MMCSSVASWRSVSSPHPLDRFSRRPQSVPKSQLNQQGFSKMLWCHGELKAGAMARKQTACCLQVEEVASISWNLPPRVSHQAFLASEPRLPTPTHGSPPSENNLVVFFFSATFDTSCWRIANAPRKNVMPHFLEGFTFTFWTCEEKH